MYRAALTPMTFLVLIVGLAAPRPADAGQGLTAVQMAFVERKPLTMLEAPEEAPPLSLTSQQSTMAGQGAVPAPRAVSADQRATPFKPTKFSKVFLYSVQLTFYTHVMRVAAQDFTRSELQGPFLQDWFDSVHMPHKWGDLDSWEVNYLGHAIFGSAAARIWLDQREAKPTTRKEYFKAMGRAFLFTVLFSEQYEIGPMSEASIGNVGLRTGRTGWSDHIWTPIGGMLWLMAEDAIDKYFLTQVDKHVPFYMARAAARMILNPGHMLANIGQNRTPWARPGRPMGTGLGIAR